MSPIGTATSVSVADWVTLEDLYRDPFPIYERLRSEAPVAWIPAAGRYFVTRYADVDAIEQDQETYSADEDNSLQRTAMGHTMVRKDDPVHAVERAAWQPVLRPRAIKQRWQQIFAENAEKYLAELAAAGPGADLKSTFAGPFASENLRRILGFENATQEDLQRWSQTMIDGTGNYANIAEIGEASIRSYNEVNTALDEMIVHYRGHPNGTMISELVNMGESELDLEVIRANMKMTISGGLNEPRDSLGVAVWGLLSNPDQLQQVLANSSAAQWNAVFDEAVRWVAPIGMYPRQTTREVTVGGVTLPAGVKLGMCILSANRDETQFENAAAFDINREKKPHLAFGGGTHFCAGAWVAKGSVAGVGLPMLFDRLKGLRLDEDRPARAGGWVFRGMLELPVLWDSVV